MISVEEKILVLSVASHPNPSREQMMRWLMSQDVDMDRVIDLAFKEGLAGLLYKCLKDTGLLDTLEEDQKERLQSLYYNTVVFNLKRIHELGTVLAVLNQENIRVVLLQGVALLPQIYDDIGLRPTTDIDLWVLERDFSSLVRILLGHGYERDELYPTTFRKGSTILDLRTHLLWAGRIRARKFLLSKSQECIHNDTRIIDFEGQKVRCLNEYDQVLYLMLHALKHNVERLIWLADIKLLVDGWKRFDWEALIYRARELGQEKPVYYTLFLLLNLFAFQPPVEARHILQGEHLNLLEKKVLQQRIAGSSLPVWAVLLLLTSGKAWSTRLAFMFETFFPMPEVMRQIFPAHPENKVWQLYCRRVPQCFSMIKKRSEKGDLRLRISDFGFEKRDRARG
jgi:hypothetical protein